MKKRSASISPKKPAKQEQANGIFSAEDAGNRLDAALSAALADLSRERIKSLLADGQVTLNGKIAKRASSKISAGDQWQITLPPPENMAIEAEYIPLDIVFEDEHLIVINKPAGLVVHPAAGHGTGTLVNALLHHCKGQLSGIGGVARPGIVHRIDKDTSGLLVVAKSDKAHQGLAAQFADHSIHRRYLALASGQVMPPDGMVEGNIGRSPQNCKKMAVVEGRGKWAKTHYRTLNNYQLPMAGQKNRQNGRAVATLLECRLETGRTHQIRVHLAHLGHALLGDPLYGRTHKDLRPILSRLGFARQALHAAELGFSHPVTNVNIGFKADLPEDIKELLMQFYVI